MAIKLKDQYPGRVLTDGNNPEGTFKDSTAPGALDGTPAQFAWARDMWAILDRFMSEAGAVYSGAPDSQVNSERYDALVKISRDVWPLWDTAHTYSIGQIVLAADGSQYQSLQNSNIGNDPISSPTFWQQFDAIAVIDNLLSSSAVDALSANQGLILKGLIDNPPVAAGLTRGVSYLHDQRIVMSNSGAANIDFSGGRFTFDDKTGEEVAPAYTKTPGSLWIPGNGGGLDTGIPATNTWYYGYAIWDPISELADYVFTATFGSPTLPAGYTKKCYQGPIRTLTVSVKPFIQRGRRFLWLDQVTDYPLAVPVLGLKQLTVPSAYESIALITYENVNTNARYSLHYPGITTPTPNCGSAFNSGNWSEDNFNDIEVLTNTVGQAFLTTISGTIAGTHAIYTKGWDDLQLED